VTKGKVIDAKERFENRRLIYDAIRGKTYEQIQDEILSSLQKGCLTFRQAQEILEGLGEIFAKRSRRKKPT
jgi:hypothetical protein